METLLIKSVMHSNPHSVGFDESLADAKALMTTHNIRHLPVRKAGQVIGILSDRDIEFAMRVDKKDAKEIKVEDAISEEPYSVTPDTPVFKVATTLSHTKYGSALIIDNGELKGIFTTVDACRLLGELLSGQLQQ